MSEFTALTKNADTKNRKHVSKKSVYSYKGEILKVNAKKSGIYTPMLKKMIEQLDIAINNNGRVLLIRFDLHQASYTADNKRMTNFRKRIKYQLDKAYKVTQIGYTWAREQDKAKAQHYHWCIWLSGDVVRYPSKLLQILKMIWDDMGGTLYTPKNCYYFIDNPNERLNAIYRLSYLAKVRGKGFRDAQTKDYQTSRLVSKVKGVGSIINY
ncbi:YagK/YfjJ domain-containing protein [Shewanella frigidimarina]|uniref:YagK/YfjJ domain-containing protein n=1 Tax=Shewanella frigidimarina TaxID=56812 RepID=UPI003D7BE2FE